MRNDGGVVEAKVYKHALHHPNGEVEGWVVFVFDVTGLMETEAVDAVVAGHLAGLFYTVKLIGAQPIVTGIQPGVAQAMTALGVSLDGVVVRATMQQALELCMRAA